MREIIERQTAAAERFRRIAADKPLRLADRYNAAVLADCALESVADAEETERTALKMAETL